MKYQNLFFVITLFLSAQQTKAQSLAINTDGSTANASALLDVKSNAKGILIPRMTRTERDAIATPATGLLIFQTAPDSIGFHYYDGTKWTWMFSNSNTDSLAWRTGGNTGTNANHFFGTVDDRDLTFKRNNVRSGYISTTNTAWGADALNPASTGPNNTAIGLQALLTNTTGQRNTAIGVRALTFNTTGSDNTAIGMETLRWNTGSGNTAVGFRSLDSNTAGFNNVAIGIRALISNTTGTSNSAVGANALLLNTTGGRNSAVGQQALNSNTSGSNNTASGYQSLFLNTTGSSNTASGYQSLYSNTTGYNNTAYGVNALYANTTGIFNTATGVNALLLNTTGSNNSAFGQQALNSNTTGSNNAALGWQSLFNNSTGGSNTAAGYQAGYLATGSNNVFLGLQAGYSETGNNKLYIANSATNPPIIYGDFSNKTLGFGTITPNATYGYAKVEIASEGYLAPADLLIRNAVNNAGYAPGLVFQHARGTLATPTTVNNGDYLSAISSMNYDGANYVLSAGLDIYADAAVAAGIVPTRLLFNTMNTAGSYATRLIIKNDGKIGIGILNPNTQFANNSGNTIAADGYGLNDQSFNWSMNTGGYAGSFFNAGTGGANSGLMVKVGGTLSTILDLSTGATQNTAGTSVMMVRSDGYVGIGTNTPTSQLHLSTNSAEKPVSATWTISSDERLKTIEGVYTRGLSDILKLNTIIYHYKTGNARKLPTDETGYGFSAQEVQKIFPEAVKAGKDGFLSLDIHPILVSYINAFKEQQTQISDLKKENEQLKNDIRTIKIKLGVN